MTFKRMRPSVERTMTVELPVTGDASASCEVADEAERDAFRTKVREAIEGCELHVEIDGIDFRITLSIDGHREAGEW